MHALTRKINGTNKKKKQKTEAELKLEKQEKELNKAGIVDDFQVSGFKLLSIFQRYKTLAISGSVIVICLVAAGFTWILFNREANEDASTGYQSALALVVSGSSLSKEDLARNESARNAFLKVSTEFPNSRVSMLAMLYAAHLSLEIDDTKKAIESFQAFLKVSNKKDLLRPLALAGLASAFETNKNLPDALKTFNEMTRLKFDINTDNTYWQIARLSKEQGLYAEAKENAEILIKRFPDSPLTRNAQMLVASLPEKKAKDK